MESVLTVKDLKSKTFAKRIGAERTTFKAGKKTPMRFFEMTIYPKRKYLSFGNGPKKTQRPIYLLGKYIETDDFRGFKNPVDYIKMSLDMFKTRTGDVIYQTVDLKMVGEPELESIVEMFYDILADVVARMDAVFGIVNNTSWDFEKREYSRWRSRNYIGGMSAPDYQEIAFQNMKVHVAKAVKRIESARGEE